MTSNTSNKISPNPDLLCTSLENGLSTFILKNELPKNRAELRLIVFVGSLYEEENERGLAHIVEHQGFKSTAHFPNKILIESLEELGCQYGPDLNASTHLFETKYKLSGIVTREDLNDTQVEKEKEEVGGEDDGDHSPKLDLAIQVLADWAGGMLIEDKDVEEERSIIMEEWRTKQGANKRMLDMYWDSIFGGNDVESGGTSSKLFAERMPIGTSDVINHCTPELVRDFYHRWYQPDRMAVVAVGDFDPHHVLNCISQRFNSPPIDPSSKSVSPSFPLYLPPPSQHFHLPSHTCSSPSDYQVVIMRDDEISTLSLSFEFFFPFWPESTVQFMREDTIRSLITSLINQRLNQIIPTAPSHYLPSADILKETFGIDIKEGEEEVSSSILSAGVSLRSVVRGLNCLSITAHIINPNHDMEEEKEEDSKNDEERSSSSSSDYGELHLNHPTVRLFIGLYTCMSLLQQLRSDGWLQEELDLALKRTEERLRKTRAKNAREKRDQLPCKDNFTSSRKCSEIVEYVLHGGDLVLRNEQEETILFQDVLDNGISLSSLNDMTRMLLSPFNQDLSNEFSHSLPPYVDSGSVSDSTNYDFQLLSAQVPAFIPKFESQLKQQDLEENLDGTSSSSSEEEIQLYAMVSKIQNLFDSNKFEMEAFAPPDFGDTFQVLPHPEELVNRLPTLSCCCCEKQQSDHGYHKVDLPKIESSLYTLDNGIEVIVRWSEEEKEHDQDSKKEEDDLETQLDSSLECTDFGGTISFQAFCLGGSTEETVDEEEAMWWLLDEVAGESGYSFGEQMQIPSESLQLFSSIYQTRVNTQRHMYHRGIGGSCPAYHMKSLLALIHLKFGFYMDETSGEMKPYQKFSNEKAKGIVNRAYQQNLMITQTPTPYALLLDKARELTCGEGSIPLRSVSSETYLKLLNGPENSSDFDTSLCFSDFYKRVFLTDVTNFKFVLSGDDMPPERILAPLLVRWLGSLKCFDPIDDSPSYVQAKNRDQQDGASIDLETFKTICPLGHVFPNEVKIERMPILNPTAEKSTCLMAMRCDLPHPVSEIFEKRFQENLQTIVEPEEVFLDYRFLDLACDILKRRLLHQLREVRKGVYSVVCECSLTSLAPTSLVSISFDTSPDMADLLCEDVVETIENLKKLDVSEEGCLKWNEVQTALECASLSHTKNIGHVSYELFWILEAWKDWTLWKSMNEVVHEGRDPFSSSLSLLQDSIGVFESMCTSRGKRRWELLDLIQSNGDEDEQEVQKTILDRIRNSFHQHFDGLNRRVQIIMEPRDESQPSNEE